MCVEKVIPIVLKKEHFAPVKPGLLAMAEREIAAFVAAVDELFGPEATIPAAEYWMEELNKVDWSLDYVDPDWRHITIAAAARLSKARSIEPSRFATGSPTCLHDGTILLPAVSDANVPVESSAWPPSGFGTMASNIREFERWRMDRLVHDESASELRELRRSFEKVQEELRRANTELIELEPLAKIGKMAESISHDFRNHLSAVYSSVEFMSDPRTQPQDHKKLQEEVCRATHEITDMLDSLLLFAQTGQSLHPRPASLNLLVEHAVNMVRIHPDARNVHLAIEDMPCIQTSVDCKKLGRAVYNLVLNACQAAKRGSTPATVEVALIEDRATIHIRIVDSGPGVPESIRKTLYEPFVSAGTAKGIGLGLTIAERVAREHGGYVSLEESIPGYTVFVLHLSKLALDELAAGGRPASVVHEFAGREPEAVCISNFAKRLNQA
jgi:signal transduction histidine kinase